MIDRDIVKDQYALSCCRECLHLYKSQCKCDFLRFICHVSVCQHKITVRLQNAEGVPPENSQRHSLEQEITLTLILKSHGKSATQIFTKTGSSICPWRRTSRQQLAGRWSVGPTQRTWRFSWLQRCRRGIQRRARLVLIVIIMVIFKCYFSGEHIALSINKNNNGVNIALGKTNRLNHCAWCELIHEINKLYVNKPRQHLKIRSICRNHWQKEAIYKQRALDKAANSIK